MDFFTGVEQIIIEKWNFKEFILHLLRFTMYTKKIVWPKNDGIKKIILTRSKRLTDIIPQNTLEITDPIFPKSLAERVISYFKER